MRGALLLLIVIAAVLAPSASRADPLLLETPGLYIILDGHSYYMAPGRLDVWVGVYWARGVTTMTGCHRSNGQPQVSSATHLTYDALGGYVYLDDRLSAWPLNYEFGGVWTLQFESKTHDIVCTAGEVVIPSDRVFTDNFEDA